MVKTKGPLLSETAAGSLGNSLVFATNKGRTYVRKKIDTPNPKTPEQLGHRALFAWLPKQWSSLTTADQASWAALDPDKYLSPYLAFLAHNLDRWHNFQSPGKAYPVAEVNRGSNAGLVHCAWVEHRIRIITNRFIPAQQWPFIIFASQTSGFTPSPDNAIIFQLDPASGQLWQFWTPPEVATWHFRIIASSDDGVKEPASAQRTATPP